MNLTGRQAVRALAALLIAGIPAAALAAQLAASITAEYAARPYTLAASCEPGKPDVFVNLVLYNGGSAPTAPVRVTGRDTTNSLVGETVLAPLPVDTQVLVTLPLRPVGSAGGSIGGTHTIHLMIFAGITAAPNQLPPLSVLVPATLCTPTPPPAAAPTPKAASTTAPAAVAAGPASPVAIRRRPLNIALATPLVVAPRAMPHAKVGTLAVGVPTNVHSTGSGLDCGAHVGPLGALVCPDMIKSGDLLLIWDWAPAAGPPDIDGYRVYRVDSSLKQLVYTRANKKDLTLVDVPKPAGGYSGKCYAVTAFVGARESALSPSFCAGSSSVAKTIRLPAIHTRSSHRYHVNTGNAFTGNFANVPEESPLDVGFSYSATQHTLGDTVHNGIHRAAVAFDMSALANRGLVAAKLHLTIATSAGLGNNHSCATNVLTGTEFWWQNSNWIEVPAGDQGSLSLNAVPTDTGPEISADVTQLVAPWLRGQPNYGFVLINTDENLGAFTNKACLTSYSNPTLEVTYY